MRVFNVYYLIGFVYFLKQKQYNHETTKNISTVEGSISRYNKAGIGQYDI
tara:strand:- start:1727 stop:1876 length:150 start_codon:yes stop_codon:yes gene_type:complete